MQRKYKCRNVELVTVSKTIAQAFKENVNELSMALVNWTEEYADNLLERIESTTRKFLGIDTKESLRQATVNLSALSKQAKREIGFLKSLIEVGIKDRVKQKEIIQKLGLDFNSGRMNNNNQETLIEVLYTISNNMTDKVRNELLACGANPSLLDNLVSYAPQLADANTLQEGMKTTTKGLTKEAATAFNAIYDEIIGICKLASKFYADDPLKKEQFTFSRVLSNLGGTRQKVEETQGEL